MSAPVIEIRAEDETTQRLWRTLVQLAESFGASERWCLVGGLMVQLHAFEHEANPRPTRDIDLLADARQRPSVTQRLGRVLDELGGHLADPPLTDPKLGYRFEIDGQIVDILAPDGLKSPPLTIGNHETMEIPGGTQALARCEVVMVSVDGAAPVSIPRPTLLGAILLKARALKVHRRPDDQRQDLALLLSFVEDPRSMATELRASERGWLRDAGDRLDFDSQVLRDQISGDELRRARITLEMLARSSG